MPISFKAVFWCALISTNARPTMPAVTTSEPSLLQVQIQNGIILFPFVLRKAESDRTFTFARLKSSEFYPFPRHFVRMCGDTRPMLCIIRAHAHCSEWLCAEMAMRSMTPAASSPNIGWYCTSSAMHWLKMVSEDSAASMPMPGENAEKWINRS